MTNPAQMDDGWCLEFVCTILQRGKGDRRSLMERRYNQYACPRTRRHVEQIEIRFEFCSHLIEFWLKRFYSRRTQKKKLRVTWRVLKSMFWQRCTITESVCPLNQSVGKRTVPNRGWKFRGCGVCSHLEPLVFKSHKTNTRIQREIQMISQHSMELEWKPVRL